MSIQPVHPLLKPSKLERLEAKQARLARTQTLRKAGHAAEYRAWQRLKAFIYSRDGGACRVCGRAVRFQMALAPDAAHVHHLVYRSAGGTDEPANLLLVCCSCHEYEHRHLISIEGNGDGGITVTRADGTVVQR